MIIPEMGHEEFVRKFRTGEIALHVDKSLAMRAVTAGLLPKGYGAAQTFYSWLWILGLLAGIPLMIWYKWWVGLIALILGFALPSAIKKTATEGVRDKLLEDPEFYDFAKRMGLFRISQTRADDSPP